MRDFKCQTFCRCSACSSLQIVSMFMLLGLSWLKLGRRHSLCRFQAIRRRRPVISESLPRNSLQHSASNLVSNPVALYVRCNRILGFIFAIASHVRWATCSLGVSIPRLHSSKSPAVFRLVNFQIGFMLILDKPSVFRSAKFLSGCTESFSRPCVFRSGSNGIGCTLSNTAPSVFRLVKHAFGFTSYFDKPSVLSHAVPNPFQLAWIDALLHSLTLADKWSQRPAQIRVEPMPFRSLFL